MTRPGDLSGGVEAGLSVTLDGSERLALRAWASHREIVLGPWPQEGQAGCWRCAALRQQTNAPYAEPEPADEPVLTAVQRSVAAALLAKEIADSLCADPSADRLAGRLAALDLRTFEVSRHRVLPVPGCPECGGPRATSGARASDHDRVIEELAELVDTKVGLIHALVVESPESTGVAQPVIATAVTACRPDGAAPPTRLPAGWGKGTTPLAAVLSAAGEALERYAASLPDPSRLVWARLDQLPADEVTRPAGLSPVPRSPIPATRLSSREIRSRRRPSMAGGAAAVGRRPRLDSRAVLLPVDHHPGPAEFLFEFVQRAGGVLRSGRGGAARGDGTGRARRLPLRLAQPAGRCCGSAGCGLGCGPSGHPG